MNNSNVVNHQYIIILCEYKLPLNKRDAFSHFAFHALNQNLAGELFCGEHIALLSLLLPSNTQHRNLKTYFRIIVLIYFNTATTFYKTEHG